MNHVLLFCLGAQPSRTVPGSALGVSRVPAVIPSKSSSQLPGAAAWGGFSLLLLAAWGLTVACWDTLGRGCCVIWLLDSFWVDSRDFWGCAGTLWAKFAGPRTRAGAPLVSNRLWAECWDTGTRLGASPMGFATFKEKWEGVNCAAAHQNFYGYSDYLDIPESLWIFRMAKAHKAL